MPTEFLPHMPPNAPRMGNALTRWIGRTMLKLMGWRIEGELPDRRQIMICAAPHTSNWDFVLAMFIVMALGVRFSYLMKKEAFFWPLKGLFMKLGGIPLDRSATEDIVEQIARWYATHDQVWLAITPEGTRARVDKWKTGFLRIACEAGVPVLLVAWDYSRKVFCLDSLYRPSGDHLSDAEQLKAYLHSKYKGRHESRQ